MLVIRLYIAALSLLLLIASLAIHTVGILEAVVITCPVLYLILDAKGELSELKQLENRVSTLLH
jgi:hypothetical protein